jgi:hypothetical protein
MTDRYVKSFVESLDRRWLTASVVAAIVTELVAGTLVTQPSPAVDVALAGVSKKTWRVERRHTSDHNLLFWSAGVWPVCAALSWRVDLDDSARLTRCAAIFVDTCLTTDRLIETGEAQPRLALVRALARLTECQERILFAVSVFRATRHDEAHQDHGR